MGETTIFLTGASGHMGYSAFQELLKNRERFNITLLLRPSKKNKKLFKEYEGDSHPPVGQRAVVRNKNLKIVWGDITNFDDVMECVSGADFVLHPAALISPEADHKPRTTWAINYRGTLNIINAIKKQPNSDDIKFVYIGSVAMYGDRLPPVHRIRVGDPLYPSIFDYYTLSKIAAERAVIESGLKHWASIRQTYIAIPDTMGLMDPIMSHQPLNQLIELITNSDAGYGLIKTIDAPDEFWNRIYNMGGGPSCRVSYYKYMSDIFRLIGLGKVEDIFERNWFAVRNFHCAYFEDSHILNKYLGFWRDSLEDHYRQVIEASPWYFKLAKFAPKKIVKMYLKTMSDPVKWIKNPEKYEYRIKAYFGSIEEYNKIPDWNTPIDEAIPEGILLDHGFKENERNEYTLDDANDAAAFRGGKCLSEEYKGFYSPLKWECAFGHKFSASPAAVMMGGHWCPYCNPPDWDYGKIAEKNPYFAQVYYHNHTKDEKTIYTLERCMEETEIREKEGDRYVMPMEQYIEEVRKS